MEKAEQINAGSLLERVVEANAAETLALVALGAGVWIIGVHILVAWHYRRVGEPAWLSLNPFAFPFKDFNDREWFAFAALSTTSLVLLGFALGWR